ACHQEALRSHDGDAARLRSPVDGRVLTNPVAVADLEPRLPAAEAEILRLSSQDRAFVDLVAGAERRVALDHGGGADLGAVADRHVVLDDVVGTDGHPRAEASAGSDDRGGVDAHGARYFAASSFLRAASSVIVTFTSSARM